MEPVLYGPLGLTPSTAGVCTPDDIRKLHAGYLWRQERELDRTALLMLAVYSAAGAKGVTVKKLIGRDHGASRISGYKTAPTTKR